MENKRIAVIIPCYNEEQGVGAVVRDARKYLPDAEIYVYDNNSTDKTVAEALAAGAIVRNEPEQGKGCVIRRAFADIDADVYAMTDGDVTYDLSRLPDLVRELEDNRLDQVIGARKEVDLAAYRVGHRFGNWLMTRLVQGFFRSPLADMLSGYRVFSRRFVKTFPAASDGFEIETELTVFALSSKFPMKEVDTDYFARAEGSVSKLATFRDGYRILKMIAYLVKDERPLFFFGLFAAALFVFGLCLGIPVVKFFIATGLVPKIPTAVLAMGVVLCSLVSLMVGLVLDTVVKGRKEARRQCYLNVK